MKAVVISKPRISKPRTVAALKIQEIDEPITPQGDVKIKVKEFGLNRNKAVRCNIHEIR